MSKSTTRKESWVKEPYVINLIPMYASPAYRAASRAAYQILARLIIEWSHQRGVNGNLCVTFAQFVEYGLHPKAVGPAIRELVALGFIEITRQGRGGNADYRQSNLYRLTFLPTDGEDPTHEWRQISEDDAKMVAKGARRPGSNSAKAAPEKQESTVGKRTDFGVGKRTKKTAFSGSESVLKTPKSPGSESVLLSNIALHGTREGEARPKGEGEPEPMAMAAMSEVCLRGASSSCRPGRGLGGRRDGNRGPRLAAVYPPGGAPISSGTDRDSPGGGRRRSRCR
jgi:hypothetical protein